MSSMGRLLYLKQHSCGQLSIQLGYNFVELSCQVLLYKRANPALTLQITVIQRSGLHNMNSSEASDSISLCFNAWAAVSSVISLYLVNLGKWQSSMLVGGNETNGSMTQGTSEQKKLSIDGQRGNSSMSKNQQQHDKEAAKADHKIAECRSHAVAQLYKLEHARPRHQPDRANFALTRPRYDYEGIARGRA